MLLEYEIENFKAIGDRQRIPIRPITLLYGANSSGKSSILQTLLLQKQTLNESQNDNTALLPVGSLVDLGMFKDYVHRHDIDNTLSFKYILKKPEHIDDYVDDFEILNNIEREYTDKLLNLLECETISAVIKFSCNQKDLHAVVSDIDLYLGDDSEPLLTYEAIHSIKEVSDSAYFKKIYNNRLSSLLKVKSINSSNDFWERYRNYDKKRLIEIFRQMSAKEQKDYVEKLKNISDEIAIYKNENGATNYKSHDENYDVIISKFRNDYLVLNNFLPEMLNGTNLNDILKDTYYGNAEDIVGNIANPSLLLLIVSSVFRNYFQNIIYLGPLRKHPERIYRRLGNIPSSVGVKGEHFQEFIAGSKKDCKLMNERFNTFGINYTIMANNYVNKDKKGSKASDIFAIELLDDQNETISNIRDVGFGISQVLPIIVQSIIAKHNTLIIEQPELHLHPALQAELGSLFAESTKPPYSNRFIIETHSEHLMLRIQKLIRKGELTPEDVSVIYVDKEKDGAKCLELRLDKEGDFIDEWPHGFFEEGYREIFGDK